MTARPLVWVTEPIHQDAWDLLKTKANVIGPGPITNKQEAEVDAVITRNYPVHKELCDQLANLKVVGKHGAGLDNIDTGLLEHRGIKIFRAAGANAASVADHSVLLALMLLRAPDLLDRNIRSGAPQSADLRVGYEPSERRIGILGMGAIGQAVASRLIKGFDATVAAYDPGLSAELWPNGVERYQDLDTLLQDTDLLFLHLPLLAETKNIISTAQLARLRPGAFIVNCARGGIVDERALADALKTGHIAGAASDVFEQEPPTANNPLFANGNRFIGTPHLAASTHAGLRRTGMIIAKKVLTALTEGKDT